MGKIFWLMRDPWFLFGVRLGPRYFKLKRTRNELFSERNGYAKVGRFAGWSFVYFKETGK